MPAKVPSGPMGGFFEQIARGLARCPSFQVWAGVTDSTAALEFIHYYKTLSPVSISGNPELAVTLEPNNMGYWFKRIASGGVGPFGGSLTISFQSATSDEYVDDESSAFAEHVIAAGEVMCELIAQMELEPRQIRQFINYLPAQAGKKNEGSRKFQQSWWWVEWGCERVTV